MTRYLTVKQQERRQRGRVVATFSLLFAVALVVGAVNATYVDVPLVTGLLLASAVGTVWGLRRAFEAQSFVDVNETARTYVITEGGRPQAVQSLDSLAPLVVSLRIVDSMFVRSKPTGGAWRGRSATGYAIYSSGRSHIALFQFRTTEQAHRKLDELAVQWRVASKTLGGQIRFPADVNVP